MEMVRWRSKFSSQSNMLIQTVLSNGEDPKSLPSSSSDESKVTSSLYNLWIFSNTWRCVSTEQPGFWELSFSFFKQWVRSSMKAIWAKYDQTILYVPQILMTGLVIYGPAVALSQGQCTQISYLILDSVSRTLECFSCTPESCCVQPCFSLQLLAPICGVETFQQALCVYCTLVSTHNNLVQHCHSAQYWATLSSLCRFSNLSLDIWRFMSFSLLQGGIKAVVWTDVFQVRLYVEINVVHDLPLECSHEYDWQNAKICNTPSFQIPLSLALCIDINSPALTNSPVNIFKVSDCHIT